MKRYHYLVRIDKELRSNWGASVPDLPGCVATARTLDCVVQRIRKAIEMHLEGLSDDGLSLPRPCYRSVVPRSSRGEIEFYADVEVLARDA